MKSDSSGYSLEYHYHHHHHRHIPSLLQTSVIMFFQSPLSSVLLVSSLLGDSFLVTKLFRLSVYFVRCLPLLLVLQIIPLNICFSSLSALFICPQNCSFSGASAIYNVSNNVFPQSTQIIF